MKYLTGLLFLFLVMSCSAQKETTSKKSKSVPTKKAESIASQNNRFAFDLYRQIADKDGNVFFSPFSISTALSMTYAGASGNTAQEMANVFYFDKNTPTFHQKYGAYLAQLNRNAKSLIELNIANRLYPEKTYQFKKTFLADVGKNYGASIEKMDYQANSEGSRKIINTWVEEQTKNRIKNLLPSGTVTPDTRMILVNAIYFKADWQESFDKNRTQKDNFKPESGGKIQADFMNAQRCMPYTETSQYKMVRLPYKGKRHSMIVVLPKGNKSLKSIEKNFDFSNIKELYAGQQEVIFKMPKFEMTLPLGLNEPLQKMGMKEAFSSAANFSNMSDGNLAISDILHKAFVKVDEEGTEAAAATAVIAVTTSAVAMPTPEPKKFIADHPFLYFVVDDATQSILFMGRLSQP